MYMIKKIAFFLISEVIPYRYFAKVLCDLRVYTLYTDGRV